MRRRQPPYRLLVKLPAAKRVHRVEHRHWVRSFEGLVLIVEVAVGRAEADGMVAPARNYSRGQIALSSWARCAYAPAETSEMGGCLGCVERQDRNSFLDFGAMWAEGPKSGLGSQRSMSLYMDWNLSDEMTDTQAMWCCTQGCLLLC